LISADSALSGQAPETFASNLFPNQLPQKSESPQAMWVMSVVLKISYAFNLECMGLNILAQSLLLCAHLQPCVGSVANPSYVNTI